MPEVLLAGYCVLIALASFAGGWLPNLITLTHTRMQLLISLIGGLMIGVALCHQIPHATASIAMHRPDFALDWCMRLVVLGLLAMFLLLRAFHFHHHEAPADLNDHHHDHTHDHTHDHRHDHDHAHDHGALVTPGLATGHHHDEPRDLELPSAHSLGWLGMTAGLVVHTLIDGMALAASVQADSLHGGGWLAGVGTFLAVCLHKPLDSLSITSLMMAGGHGWPARRAVNFAYALICPLGALLFVLGVRQLSGTQHLVVGGALAFSAGAFLCIALGDLLPEVQFHSHDRWPLSLALLAGVALALAIGFLEPEHAHSHGGGHSHGVSSAGGSHNPESMAGTQQSEDSEPQSDHAHGPDGHDHKHDDPRGKR